MKDFYFFFDKDVMPVAIFLTETVEEAIKLFGRLYRRPWEASQELGITVVKEADVPAETWNEIHRRKVKIEPTPVRTAPIKLNERPRMPQCSGLESEKYMSR